ncbi:hypothetical protein P343_01750 [Sporolactobacillus laevolacticus DSM 442]|uniref:Uncharacterized protein n=1 Tax=Sporolactobacillus laevolacticus DSM 442 TaxID=1395513 RepID=V6J1N1_9BACL|nr:hypothetical protein P343_01750 [Sporolactobacillus laevolacticus DSM 442]
MAPCLIEGRACLLNGELVLFKLKSEKKILNQKSQDKKLCLLKKPTRKAKLSFQFR